MAAQAAHASFKAFLNKKYSYENSSVLKVELSEESLEWLCTGTTKICLGVDSEEELFSLEKAAKRTLYRTQADKDRYFDGLRKAGLK